MEKALGETLTQRAGCSKAEPKFSPHRRTPSRGRIMAKIKSAGDGHCLHLLTQFGEDRCTQFRVIMVTDPQTHTHKYTPPVRPPATDRTNNNTLRR